MNKLLAAFFAMAGSALATNHTGNGTTPMPSTSGAMTTSSGPSGGGGGGPATTTGSANATTPVTIVATLSIGITLPTGVTAANVTATTVPYNAVAATTCTAVTGGAKPVCAVAVGGLATMGGSSFSVTSVALAARRSLSERRELTATNFEFGTTATFATDAAAATAAAKYEGTGLADLGTNIGNAAGTDYTIAPPTVKAGTFLMTASSGTTYATPSAAAASGTTTGTTSTTSTSDAYTMGVSSLALATLFASLF